MIQGFLRVGKYKFKNYKAKVAIIGEIWKSRAKLLKNRLFEKIASAGKATQL